MIRNNHPLFFGVPMSEYENDLEPLATIIDIKCQFDVYPFLVKQLSIYNDHILTNSTSKDELQSFLKNIVNTILSDLFSRAYLDKLQSRYFSKEGLMLFVFYLVYEKAIDYLKEKR